MKNQKNNSGLIILVVVLFLVVLGMGGYIIYDKVLSNKNEQVKDNPNKTVEKENNVDVEVLPEWAEYLLKQNISSVTVTNRTCSIDTDGMHESSENLTIEQLRDVLADVTKTKLTKYKDVGGFGGPCLKNIKVKYNDTKEFELFLYRYISINNTDSEIINLLEKENYVSTDTIGNTPVSENPNSMFEYDWDGTYLDNILG